MMNIYSKELKNLLKHNNATVQIPQIGTVKSLLTKGADPKTSIDGRGYLETALSFPPAQFEEVIEIFKANKKSTPRDYSFALKYYLTHFKKIDFKIVEQLIKAGAHPYTKNLKGQSVFTRGVASGWSKDNFLSFIKLCKENLRFTFLDFIKASIEYSGNRASKVDKRQKGFDYVKNMYSDECYFTNKERKHKDALLEKLKSAQLFFYNNKPEEAVLLALVDGSETYAKRLVDKLLNNKLNTNDIKTIACSPGVKESVIRYIDELENSDTDKMKIMHAVYEPKSQLNQFFNVRRGLFPTTEKSGSFIELNKINKDLNSAQSHSDPLLSNLSGGVVMES